MIIPFAPFGAVYCYFFVRYMVFFVIVVKTRAVEIAGIRVDPDGEWMKQMARNLTDPVEGFLRNATYLIHDRDPLFTAAFKEILKDRGAKCVKIPAQSPNCNPHAARSVETIKYECLNHFVSFGERHLRYVIKEFVAHYHRSLSHLPRSCRRSPSRQPWSSRRRRRTFPRRSRLRFPSFRRCSCHRKLGRQIRHWSRGRLPHRR